MRFGVIVFPGSNCDVDAVRAIGEVLGGEVEPIWHETADLSRFGCVLLPGGFSYGDYLRPGAIARFSPAVEALHRFAASGRLVLGICNGFQILCETGLLPGALLPNRDLRFHCEPVHLRVENAETPFTRRYRPGEILTLPIAHGEGSYYIDEAGLARLEANRQVVFRYVSPEGEASEAANPNGSVANIAGICNEEGNVLGMMPHPERAVEALLGGTDGAPLFAGLIAAGREAFERR